MKRILFGLLACLVATPAMAQVRVPIYQDRNGSYQGADASICLNVDGTACPAGTVSDPIYTTPSTGPTNVAQGSTTAGQTGALVQCAVTTAAPTYVTATTNPLSCDTSGNQRIAAVGNVASNAPDVGGPVKIGGTYSASGTISALTVGNRGDAQLDGFSNLRARMVGGSGIAPSDAGTTSVSVVATNSNSNSTVLPLNVLNYVWSGTNTIIARGDASGTVNQPYALAASRWSYAAASGGISNTSTAVTVKAAAGASVINYVTGIQCMAGTLGAATEIAYRDGAGGTVLWRGYLSTAGGMITFAAGAALKGTANTLGEIVTLSATVTGGVYCNVQGYTAL